VPGGNVYLYSHNLTGVDDAQKLILAESGEVSTTVDATADFFDTASLAVSKTVDGAAAGLQSEVRISVACGDLTLPDFVVPAGTKGTTSTVYDAVPAPSTCQITETVNGVNTAVTVSTVNASQAVDLPQTDVPDDPVTALPVTSSYVATAVGPDVVAVTPVAAQPRFTG
jgi:hypothetical protein